MKVSEATLVWERWRQGRRFKRNLASWGGSTLVAAAVLALAAWGGFPSVFDVGEKGEAISVKLGNPEGEDLPLSVSAVPDQAMQAVMSAQRDSALTTVEETRAVTEPSTEPAPVPVKPQAAKPTPTTKPEPTPKPVVPTPPTDKPAVTEKVIRGSEKGNSSELILKPQGDKISQNAYWPVYLFMPLPKKLDAGLLGRVKDLKKGDGEVLYSALERRDLLLQYYDKGTELALKADAPLEVRPAIWVILEEAGYDVANADYKKGRELKPVVISFQLSIPTGNGGKPDLLEVKLEQSSGNGPVDEAVLYAFQKSSFANGTGKVAQGRYTYDFSAKK